MIGEHVMCRGCGLEMRIRPTPFPTTSYRASPCWRAACPCGAIGWVSRAVRRRISSGAALAADLK
jgi:hypothetical protein